MFLKIVAMLCQLFWNVLFSCVCKVVHVSSERHLPVSLCLCHQRNIHLCHYVCVIRETFTCVIMSVSSERHSPGSLCLSSKRHSPKEFKSRSYVCDRQHQLQLIDATVFIFLVLSVTEWLLSEVIRVRRRRAGAVVMELSGFTEGNVWVRVASPQASHGINGTHSTLQTFLRFARTVWWNQTQTIVHPNCSSEHHCLNSYLDKWYSVAWWNETNDLW